VAKTILLVGVPWSTHELTPAIRDAATLGARLHLVDTEETLAALHPGLDCERVPVAALDLASVLAAARAVRPDCVVSITELTMELAARVREELGHDGTPAAAERAVSDKPATREVLRDNGLTQVRFWTTTTAELPALARTLPLPVVAKPRSLTGSAGVRMIASVADAELLARQYDAARSARFGRDRLLVETYVGGVEISAEGLVVDGELTLFTLTDKVNTQAPYFVELGHLMPSRFSAEWQPRVHGYLQRCVTALGVRTSPVHAEVKLVGDQVELIELHTRFGGDNIVALLEETFALRPFEAYFAAMLGGSAPRVSRANTTWGVAFFTVPMDQAPPAGSFAFPHPEAVMRIDFDRRTPPKLREYEGVRLMYWRAGHALFASADYAEVLADITFLAAP
jgi:biotin carboxylase